MSLSLDFSLRRALFPTHCGTKCISSFNFCITAYFEVSSFTKNYPEAFGRNK